MEWKDGSEGGNTFAVVGGDCAVVELEMGQQSVSRTRVVVCEKSWNCSECTGRKERLHEIERTCPVTVHWVHS